MRYRPVCETMACVSSWKAARNMTKHAKPDPQPPPGKQAKPNSQPPSGRIAFDERGNAIWQWGTDVDTQQVKALKDSSADSLSIEDEPPGSPVNHDPYSTASRPPQPFRRAHRRRWRKSRSAARWMICAA